MKTAISFFVVATLFLAVPLCAQAQWPLGKEMGQNMPKMAESSSVITMTGRYQMFVSPNTKGHTFMIDTETGRLWIMKKDVASGDFSMQRIPVQEVDQSKQGTANKDSSKKSQAKPADE
jgi:hypothetical protein